MKDADPVASPYVKLDANQTRQRQGGDEEEEAGRSISLRSWSRGRRWIVVFTAVLACLLNSGVSFGFSALLPELIRDGAFHDLCAHGQALSRPCRSQSNALMGMFTLTSSSLNLVAMPVGFIIDHLGPKTTATAALLVQCFGFLLFAQGSDGVQGHLAYFVGFMVLGVFGPMVMNCVFSFANLIPGKESLITASMVGAFDAASSIFLVLSSLMERGVSFSAVFQGYAAVPLAAAIVAVCLWPRRAVEMDLAAGIPRRLSEASSLVAVPVAHQMRSLEYLLALYACSINMLTINFFIGTIFLQMWAVDESNAQALTKAFAVCLPLGGVIFVPLIGAVLKHLGVTKGFCLLLFAFLLFLTLMGLYAATSLSWIACLAFVIFAFCRPLFYTLGAKFVGQTFGFGSFGRLYGLLTTACGAVNMFGQALSVIGQDHGFFLTNIIICILQLTTAAFPLYLLFRRGRDDNTP